MLCTVCASASRLTCLVRVSVCDAGIRAERAVMAAARIAPLNGGEGEERVPKALIARFFRQGSFVDGVSGVRVSADARLAAGACVRLDARTRGPAIVPAAAAIGTNEKGKRKKEAPWVADALIWSDNAIALISKPPGVHTQRGGVNVASDESSVDDALSALAVRAGASSLRLVHRLDAGVGGLMLLAKTRASAEALSASLASGSALALAKTKTPQPQPNDKLRARALPAVKGEVQSAKNAKIMALPPQIRKAYLGVVEGSSARSLSARLSGLRAGDATVTLRTPWLKASGTIVADVLHAAQTAGAPPTRKPAVTRFAVVQASDSAVLLLLEPQTGRKHQLRQHVANQLGGALAGDGRYGGGGWIARSSSRSRP